MTQRALILKVPSGCVASCDRAVSTRQAVEDCLFPFLGVEGYKEGLDPPYVIPIYLSSPLHYP